ncbi:MAG TPA: chemotaxis protein CheW [Burkholderiales bacterium]
MRPMPPGDDGILRARALALARPPADSRIAQTSVELLAFRLGEERYALESRHVREVHPLKNLTRLPCTPAFVLGVVNLRGRILPVLDLKRFFGLPETGLTDLHRIIVVGSNDLEFGVMADMGVGVISIPEESILAAMPTLTDIGAQYVRGVTAERLVVLDVGRILADPGILVHEEVDT